MRGNPPSIEMAGIAEPTMETRVQGFSGRTDTGDGAAEVTSLFCLRPVRFFVSNGLRIEYLIAAPRYFRAVPAYEKFQSPLQLGLSGGGYVLPLLADEGPIAAG